MSSQSQLNARQNAEKPKIEFGGKVTVGTLTFEGKFWQEEKIQALIATYHPKPPATSEDINITTLVGKLPIGDAMPKLTIGLKDALFVYEKTKSAFLFGVDLNINATISTSGLGPIGSLLGGAGDRARRSARPCGVRRL